MTGLTISIVGVKTCLAIVIGMLFMVSLHQSHVSLEELFTDIVYTWLNRIRGLVCKVRCVLLARLVLRVSSIASIVSCDMVKAILELSRRRWDRRLAWSRVTIG